MNGPTETPPGTSDMVNIMAEPLLDLLESDNSALANCLSRVLRRMDEPALAAFNNSPSD